MLFTENLISDSKGDIWWEDKRVNSEVLCLITCYDMWWKKHRNSNFHDALDVRNVKETIRKNEPIEDIFASWINLFGYVAKL